LLNNNVPQILCVVCFIFHLTRTSQFCFIKCYMYEYKYINSKKTWTEAQEYCRKNHTNLATVTNMTDVKRLNKKAKQRPAWIGLKNHTSSNKTWHWSLPGVSFNKNKTCWNVGEPNNDGSELCVLLTKDLTWIDDKCSDEHCFICYNGEFKLLSVLTGR
uniref:C-type lectin domain-containing protein n=1 Tax=Oryzias melastigma TaxID=30732 RepID=A0A3B3CRX4_ORYME